MTSAKLEKNRLQRPKHSTSSTPTRKAGRSTHIENPQKRSISNCIHFSSLVIEPHEITIEKRLLYSKTTEHNTKELCFKGFYKGLEVDCVCIPEFEAEVSMLVHEFRASLWLSGCRNMSSIYTLFDATLSEMNVDIEGYAPNYSAVFLVKQHFANNSLKKYLEKRRKNGFDIEPIHAVQMGVNIFSMLADAHQISTYLIDITTKSLYVDTDGRLCFTSFRSALNSQQRRQPKPWLNTDHLIFPEKSDNGLDTYSEATDVFLACAVIMNIITDNNKRNFKAFKIDHSKERVTVSEDVIDKRNRILLEAIRPGLAYAPENRSPALKILKSLESILNQSTFTRLL